MIVKRKKIMVAEKKTSVKIQGMNSSSGSVSGKGNNNRNNNNNNNHKKVKHKVPILLLPPPPMPKIPQIDSAKSVDANRKFLQFVGPSCGTHASYTFYKAIKYVKNGQTKILSLGEFFFVKIWPNSDLVAIGELQLLWEDKNTNQTLSSLRLYFLPEYTPEGRMHYHGEDEIVAVSEKAVLRVSDLLDWIASPKEIQWDRGLKGICEADCQPLPGSKELHQYDKGLNAKFSPGHSEFLADVRHEKEAIGDVPDLNDLGVIIINSSQYSRYRAVLKRIQGVEKNWMHNSLIVSLGGFTTQTRKTHILFCREIFDYAELEEHPYLCNHLAPKLKGRPRKRKKIKRPGSPESESASSESSASTSVSVSAGSTKSTSKNGIKKDLLSILSQKNTKEETEFLKKLISFMECRNTPIERPPMLGYKQIDLHLFFEKVAQLGGYDGCMTKKAWKSIYDDLGGNPQNTSAATCTRRHYEKFLLPFERHTKGLEEEDKQIKQRRESESGSEKSPASSVDTKHERLKSETSEDAQEKSETPPTDESEQPEKKTIEEEEVAKSEPNEEKTNEKNNLLDQVKNLIGNSKSDSQMKIDPEGKQLQIDDLIIIPNNMAATPPEGGSALQNLAKIASRYQDKPKELNLDVSAPKKAKIDHDAMSTTPPSRPSTATPTSQSLSALATMNPMSMTPAQQQSLLAMFQPSLFMPKSTSSSSSVTTPSTASTASSMAKSNSLFSPFAGLGDPSKLGPEAMKLLQMFDTTLKAAVGSTSGTSPSATPLKSSSSPKPRNASGSSSASSPSLQSAKDRDKNKISRLPFEAKRPPALPGHSPCAFAQTSNIYTNPFADLAKAKESSSASATDGALDLSGKMTQARTSSSSSVVTGGLNLKKESALKATPMMASNVPMVDLSMSSVKKNEVKVSPFSAEALLSKSSSSRLPPPPSPRPLSSASASKPRDPTPPRRSPLSSNYTRASPLFSTQTNSDTKSSSSRSSPWHTPVTSAVRPVNAPVTSANKPAIPVSPVVREDKNKADLSFQAALLGLSGGTPTSTAAVSMASMGLPPTSYGNLSAAQQQSLAVAAASNPYLAMAAAGMPKTSTASTTPSFPTAQHLMDPASAYYAALYSQTLYGMSPYAGMRLPGLTPPAPSAPPAPPPSSAGGAAGMDLLALHAMMSRGQNPAAAAAAAAANPYAAAAAAGYPPGLSGLLGYPGFGPPAPPSSGRKDP